MQNWTRSALIVRRDFVPCIVSQSLGNVYRLRLFLILLAMLTKLAKVAFETPSVTGLFCLCTSPDIFAICPEIGDFFVTATRWESGTYKLF